jgi:hypothetical protein
MAQDSSPYDVVIADLEAKRDQINVAIDMLRALRVTGAITLPASVPTPTQKPITSSDLEIPRDAFFGMTIPEAAKKYLAMVKVTKPNSDLCVALLKGGFKTQANNFSEVVRSTLQRHADFVKVSGEWGLAEWYGNRGGGRRFRRGVMTAVESSENNEPPEESAGGSSD